MSEKTPNLQLPYILANQAQKHVTHNEAIRNLDALVQISLEDKDLTTPPVTPTDGERHIVAAGASGDWLGNDNMIASWQDEAWQFYAPEEGWVVWIKDENMQMVYDGTQWQSLSSGGGASNLNPADGGLVGVNATANSTNRLSVTSPASLFNHEGTDHQLKINKNTAADNASVLFQAAFSGRAEFGLTGDDDFHMKVSPDGTTFHEGIVIDKDTGEVSFPNSTIGSNPAHIMAARVYDTTAQTFPNGVLTPVSFNALDYDQGGFWSAANPDRLTIPTGVSRIICYAGIAMSSEVTSAIYSEVRFSLLDSSGTPKKNIACAQQNLAPVKTSGPIAVSAGDYIQFLFYQASGSSKTAQTTGLTFLALEVLA